MKAIAVLLMALMVAKDAVHIGDRFIMRGTIQGACLLYGLLWLLVNLRAGWAQRYLPVWLYLLVLLASAALSEFFAYSALEVLSLLSVVTFSIAVAESARDLPVTAAIRAATGWTYLIVCAVSLAGIYVMHDLVYQSDVAGGKRFSGLFGRPAMLGEAAGILLGIALFGRFRWRNIRLPVQAAAVGVALLCLLLTGARTFWVGALAAALATSWLYVRARLKVYLGIAVVAACGLLFATVANYHVSEASQKKLLRTESIGNLTGRTEVWAEALKRVAERPWLGYGFGAGGLGMTTDNTMRLSSPGQGSASVPTLHNGYVQSLVDSGILGTALYTLIILFAIWRMVWRDRRREFGAEFFALTFLAVSNMGESVIFAAATFPSIFFWYAAILALSLRRPAATRRQPAVAAPAPAPRGAFT